jgi:hypothetical protein
MGAVDNEWRLPLHRLFREAPMNRSLSRRDLLAVTAVVAFTCAIATAGMAADKIQLRLSSVNSETDQRAIALVEKFGPAVAEFASFEPH